MAVGHDLALASSVITAGHSILEEYERQVLASKAEYDARNKTLREEMLKNILAHVELVPPAATAVSKTNSTSNNAGKRPLEDRSLQSQKRIRLAWPDMDAAGPAPGSPRTDMHFLPTPGDVYVYADTASGDVPCIAMVLPYSVDIGFPSPEQLSAKSQVNPGLSPAIRDIRINNAILKNFDWDLPASARDYRPEVMCVPAMILSGALRNAWLVIQHLSPFRRDLPVLNGIKDLAEAMDLYETICGSGDLYELENPMSEDGLSTTDDDMPASEPVKASREPIAKTQKETPAPDRSSRERPRAQTEPAETPVQSTKSPAADTVSLPSVPVAAAPETPDTPACHPPALPAKSTVQSQADVLPSRNGASSLPSQRPRPTNTRGFFRRSFVPPLSSTLSTNGGPVRDNDRLLVEAYLHPNDSPHHRSEANSNSLLRLVEDPQKKILEADYSDSTNQSVGDKGKGKDKDSKGCRIHINPQTIQAMYLKPGKEEGTRLLTLQSEGREIQRLLFRTQFLAKEQRDVTAGVQARRMCMWIKKINPKARYDADMSQDTEQDWE